MVKINFKGLVAQFKNRFRLLPVAGAANLYDLVPERGTVTQEGDEITAEAMNQLQANVEQAIGDLQESVAQDMADLEAASGEALKQAQLEADTRYSNALTGTASGAMAHMTDVSGIGSLRRLAARGETRESGTGGKGPDNPYAVDGVTPTKATVCGKNLLPKMTIASGTYHSLTVTNNPDGSVTLNGTPTNANVWYAGSYNLPTVFFRLPAGIYTASPGIWLFVTSSTDSYQGTFELSEPTNFCGVRYRGKTGHSNLDTYNNETIYPQVVMGQTLPDYEPYTGITVALPEISPLYGNGMINDEYDAATGIETRRWKRMELDGTESGWRTSPTEDNTKLRYVLPAPDALNPPTTYDMPDITCTHYAAAPPYNNWRSTQSVCVSSGSLVFFDTVYGAQDLAAWKAYLAAQKAAGTPVAVVYRLAEPVVTQRDPARVIPPAPVCNVYADQGDVDVTYNRDINIVLSQMQAAIIASGGVI